MNKPDISGIFPPLVTPLTADLELDREAMARLVGHVVAGGVHGLFVLGSTGETASLTRELRHETIRTAIRAADGRVPVLVNVTTASYLETLRLADFAAGEGARALVAAPPFYYDMTQAELAAYFEQLADHISLPLVLYNVPQYTGTAIKAATVARLSGHENIMGIKDSSGDMIHMHRLLRERGDGHFVLLVGDETLLGECLKLGCNGGISGGANMFPALYVRLYEAATRKEPDQVEKWQAWINRVQKEVYRAVSSPVQFIIGIKYVLSVKGICSTRMAMPIYHSLTGEQKKTMEELVSSFNSAGF